MNPIRRSIGHLVSCKDVSRLLSQAEDRPMSAWERARVQWHLAVCGMCRAFDRQLAIMRETMRRFRS
jgi:predicted anti-sigma-YlaC factor YlaD